MSEKKIRVLISKIGLDGHDRGAKLVAYALKDAGMEVFYQGIRHTIDEVVEKAVHEKVEFIGISFLAGDHLTMVPRILEKLKEKKAGDIKLIVGGIILKKDIPELEAMGVQHVFLPGTTLEQIANYIKENAAN